MFHSFPQAKGDLKKLQAAWFRTLHRFRMQDSDKEILWFNFQLHVYTSCRTLHRFRMQDSETERE